MAGSVLSVPPDLWRSIREDLLSTPELERAGVGFAGVVGGANGRPPERLLLRDWTPVPPDEYLVQLGYHLEVSPTFWARAAKRSRTSSEALVLLHSHPRDPEAPQFSGSDDAGEDRLIPKLHDRAPVSVAAVVASPGGQTVRFAGRSRRDRSLVFDVVGSPRSLPAAGGSSERHDRQVRALGQDGQAILAGLTVGVVGAGGLGSHVIQQLLHLGVGSIVVVDPDRVSLSNMSRLVGASRLDVRFRRRKVTVARRLARRVGSTTSVVPVPVSVNEAQGAEALLGCDVMIGCTDNQWSRTTLNALAYQYYVPALDLGVELQVAGAAGGRVAWLAPGSPCLWCLGILDSDRVRTEQLPDASRDAEIERGYIAGLDEAAPAVVSINGVIASLGVTELLARFTGFAGDACRPDLLIYRLRDGDVRRVGAASRLGCPTCTVAGALGAGNLATAPWLVPADH